MSIFGNKVCSKLKHDFPVHIAENKGKLDYLKQWKFIVSHLTWTKGLK